MIESASPNKEHVFSTRDRDFWKSYGTRMAQIDKLVHDSGRSKKFLDLWMDIQTDSKFDTGQRTMPDSASFDIFERSFKFFESDAVSPSVLSQLVELQLNQLITIEDEELKNACGGVWAFYLFPEKFIDLEELNDADGQKIRKTSFVLRNELKRILQDMLANGRGIGNNSDKQDQNKIFYLSLVEHLGDKMYPETENMEYFAKMYAHDQEGVFDLSSFDHSRLPSQNIGGERHGSAGVEQSAACAHVFI